MAQEGYAKGWPWCVKKCLVLYLCLEINFSLCYLGYKFFGYVAIKSVKRFSSLFTPCPSEAGYLCIIFLMAPKRRSGIFFHSFYKYSSSIYYIPVIVLGTKAFEVHVLEGFTVQLLETGREVIKQKYLLML